MLLEFLVAVAGARFAVAQPRRSPAARPLGACALTIVKAICVTALSFSHRTAPDSSVRNLEALLVISQVKSCDRQGHREELLEPLLLLRQVIVVMEPLTNHT